MAGGIRRTKLWDLPVRLVHWSFVALLPALWWTGEEGEIDLHRTLGLIMLGLVVFRVLWGLYGSSTARFASFVKGPRAVLAYVRGLRGGEHRAVAGHNAAGGWSVVILLSLLAAQVSVGLFAQDVDGIASGPLNYMVSYETGDALRGVHGLLFNLILLFAIVHIAAIIFYTFVKKDPLVPPMVSGSRDLPEDLPPPRIAPLWKAIPAAVLAAALAVWIGMGAPRSLEQATAPPLPSAEDYM